MTFLIDEIGSHLHPKWQRKIIIGVIEALEKIQYLLEQETFQANENIENKPNNKKIQIIATTHSPLVMVTLEDYFNCNIAKWFDFDLEKNGKVNFLTRDFEKHSDANSY